MTWTNLTVCLTLAEFQAKLKIVFVIFLKLVHFLKTFFNEEINLFHQFLHTVAAEGFAPSHIVVMYQGHFWKVDIYDQTGRLFTPPQLQKAFQRVLYSGLTSTGSNIGALTCSDRTDWFEVDHSWEQFLLNSFYFSFRTGNICCRCHLRTKIISILSKVLFLLFHSAMTVLQQIQKWFC